MECLEKGYNTKPTHVYFRSLAAQLQDTASKGHGPIFSRWPTQMCPQRFTMVKHERTANCQSSHDTNETHHAQPRTPRLALQLLIQNSFQNTKRLRRQRGMGTKCSLFVGRHTRLHQRFACTRPRTFGCRVGRKRQTGGNGLGNSLKK